MKAIQLEQPKQFRRIDVPRYESFTKYKHRLIADKRQGMRLESFKPKVMSAFVRNRLIDEVYLPLIGDNLAKQLGATGAQTRTDRMGLLLLISPPGYGKTTLVEYIADRLGITYIKINGPALGHNVTSLDPGEAPNAAAREEIERELVEGNLGIIHQLRTALFLISVLNHKPRPQHQILRIGTVLRVPRQGKRAPRNDAPDMPHPA